MQPLQIASSRIDLVRFAPFIAAICSLFFVMNCGQDHAAMRKISPILHFPEIGLDDSAVYRGYTTRFYKDAAGNTLQIYLNQTDGRVVHVWADAYNESLAFTARNTQGAPVAIDWLGPEAETASDGSRRRLRYRLAVPAAGATLGHFVLNSMRIERDFQYFQRHKQPFDAEPFIPRELTALIENISRLPDTLQARHLALLQARSLDELRRRCVPKIEQVTPSRVRIRRPYFDGRYTLTMEIEVDPVQARLHSQGDTVEVEATRDSSFALTISLESDAPALTPLTRDAIFNEAFFGFYEKIKASGDTLGFRRLERQVKSMELLSSQEKLMAGLPNYGTYFGRDMIMSALMLEPVLRPEMLEHVIASVLRKLTPEGEVSHEEGLGGQAIRENAAKYNAMLAAYFAAQNRGDDGAARRQLVAAEQILAQLNRVTENYRMRDDDFQLPVLVARYLSRQDVPAAQKRRFLEATVAPDDGAPRLARLLRNLIFVAEAARSYATNPVATQLVSFHRLEAGGWHSGSWRDSRAGYANGRFAMDINAIWVPKALASVQAIFAGLTELGYTGATLVSMVHGLAGSRLGDYLRDPSQLGRDLRTWQGAVRHFEVRLTALQVQQAVQKYLAWLPEPERRYWQRTLAENRADRQGLRFLALSLDENGTPIPVPNTDIATSLFLNDLVAELAANPAITAQRLDWLRILITPYPVGLLIPEVGPVVANDVYAPQMIWEQFARDLYHSPRVIWGREVNLILLGLAKHVLAAPKKPAPEIAGLLGKLRRMLDTTLHAVEASGLLHNELWSYRIENGRLLPARYPVSTDIQLWNLTNLAVTFLLDRLP